MGLKQGAIGNTLGEQTGNLMGTHWELEGNKGKMKKNTSPPTQNLRGKKSRHLKCMLSAYPLAACIFGTPFTKHTVPLGNILGNTF
jgi:hypothetical protein